MKGIKRIKNAKELAKFREDKLKEQGYLDPLTLLTVLAPCVDHDHVSGHCRAVLDRSMNTVEGKVTNAFRRYLSHVPKEQWAAILFRLAEYWTKDFRCNPLYPSHINTELRKFKVLTAKEQCDIVLALGAEQVNLKNIKTRVMYLRKYLLKHDLTFDEVR